MQIKQSHIDVGQIYFVRDLQQKISVASAELGDFSRRVAGQIISQRVRHD